MVEPRFIRHRDLLLIIRMLTLIISVAAGRCQVNKTGQVVVSRRVMAHISGAETPGGREIRMSRYRPTNLGRRSLGLSDACCEPIRFGRTGESRGTGRATVNALRY